MKKCAETMLATAILLISICCCVIAGTIVFDLYDRFENKPIVADHIHIDNMTSYGVEARIEQSDTGLVVTIENDGEKP
jgi:hypothetical protein